MISGFILQKGKMSGTYDQNGKRLTLTQLTATPVAVTQLKTKEIDGYQSVQLAYGTRKLLKNPIEAKLKKLKVDQKPLGFIEFKLQPEVTLTLGQSLTPDQIFKPNDIIAVTGISKGRGFAGVVKRHGFQRQPVTGGQSDRTRAPGAIGAQTPGKVVKGKRMPGHYGNKTATVLNLKVFSVDQNSLYVVGGVPGHLKSWLVVTKK